VKILSLTRNQEVLFKSPRCLNNQFYRAFAEEYNKCYTSGMIPKDIKDHMMKLLNCGSTAYQNYLREARVMGYISITANDTRDACLQRNSTTFSRNLTKPKKSLSLWQKIKAALGFAKK